MTHAESLVMTAVLQEPRIYVPRYRDLTKDKSCPYKSVKYFPDVVVGHTYLKGGWQETLE